MFFSACGTSKTAATDNVEINTPANIRIAWDYTSMQQIADRGGYPRLSRLKDNSIIVIYETLTGDIVYRRSYDNGVTWIEPVTVFSHFDYSNDKGEKTRVNMSNSEITQLKNGDIIVGCNYRPSKAEIAPYSIAIRRSRDNGKTWLPPQILYNAAPRFRDGCWEPSFLQLPNGELQVYFANENPYQQSDEQEISVIRSKDNGETWSKVNTVSFRKDRRDGMPVATIVEDEIVVVIEDNNIDRFKPYTVRTKIEDNWQIPVLANSPNRNYALAEKMNDTVYMGAPYILKLPTGETAISYQTNEDRASNWELSTIEVAIGDNTAHHFANRTRPFNVPLDKEAKWNSLALWDENTVVALASTNFKSRHVAPWLIKGYIISDLTINSSEISELPIFIGSKGSTNIRVGLGVNKNNLYIKSLIKGNRSLKETDLTSTGINLYLSNDKEMIKIWCDLKGNATAYKNESGRWVKKSSNNVKSTIKLDSNGDELEIVISKEDFGISGKKSFDLCLSLVAYDDENNIYEEILINSDELKPETWLKVNIDK
ncbi:MAG: sialidase family protein [Dysgonomonas sp.]